MPKQAERCALSLVAMLSGYTREGSVIAVDTRLRPHGSEGELVASSRQLAQYFESEAKAWETLAFGKLRLIAGAQRLAEEAAESLGALRKRFAASPEFIPELRAMRKRIADSGGAESFKTSPGGLYDLDFLVGMLEARAALPAAGKQLRQRLEALRERELLTAGAGQGSAACRRAVSSRGSCDPGSGGALPEVAAGERSSCGQAWSSLWDVPAWTGVLRAEMRAVRAIFDSYFPRLKSGTC